MKLKRSELRQIIKEELSDVVQEGSEDLRILVKFEGGSLKLEYGEVQVHNEGEHTVLHIPPSAILELAEKLDDVRADAAIAADGSPKEITVTQSDVDALGRHTDRDRRRRRWRLGL